MRQGKDINKLIDVVEILSRKDLLDIKFRNHDLYNTKKYIDCKECHIEPDWLLLYKYIDKDLVLLLVNTGSHSNLFKK